MIESNDRQKLIDLVDEAVNSGARRTQACELLGICARTLQRWQRGLHDRQSLNDLRKEAANKRIPHNRLTDEERDAVLKLCNQPQNQSLSPCQIVPRLADEDQYIASESSFYRILREADQVNRRGRANTRKAMHKPKAFKATKPNHVWSWDITFLAAAIRGDFYRLYMIEDIYSRKIVGWEVHLDENSANASCVITKSCLSEGITHPGLVLHSDNGSPMKGATMLSTLQRLGVIPSFSRPSVSDDNPYSESLFRTMKYTPAYPTKPFESIESARQWVHGFVQWYNTEHRHSSISFVTPQQRHEGKDVAILKNRKKVYQAARKRHPERWSGKIRNWEPVTEVWLNPPKENHKNRPKLLEAA